MKAIAAVLSSLLLNPVAHANDTCIYPSSNYAPGPGDRIPGQFEGYTPEGNLVYEVRVLNNGGTVAYLVTVTRHCAFVSRSLRWSD